MIRSIDSKNLSRKTIQKINRMIDAVLAEPELYDQDTFVHPLEHKSPNICNTTSCGAGWAIYLENRNKFAKMMAQQLEADSCSTGYIWDESLQPNWVGEALAALNLKVDDDFNISTLFGVADEWPYPFNERYENAKTPKQRAQVFARRWRNFIKADGMEDN